jgi:hypothetical protein
MTRSALSRIAVMVGAAALAAPLATAAFAADNYPPSIIALSQKPKAGDVSITYANLPKKGTLAIFASDAEGRMGKTRVGKVALNAGDHRNIRVRLSPMPRQGATVWTVLEQADGKPFDNQRSAADRSFKVL